MGRLRLLDALRAMGCGLEVIGDGFFTKNTYIFAYIKKKL